MNVLYYSNTHKDGNLRWPKDHKFKHWCTINCHSMWIVHLLDPAKGMTLEEILVAANDYEKLFQEARSIQKDIAYGLLLLLEDELIRISWEHD